MKKSEAIKLLEAGYIGFIAEYRAGFAREIPYVSKQTGKSMVMKKIEHTVEVNGQSVLLSERVKDDVDLSKWTQPVPKGQACLVKLSSFTNDMGSLKAGGTAVALLA